MREAERLARETDLLQELLHNARAQTNCSTDGMWSKDGVLATFRLLVTWRRVALLRLLLSQAVRCRLAKMTMAFTVAGSCTGGKANSTWLSEKQGHAMPVESKKVGQWAG